MKGTFDVIYKPKPNSHAFYLHSNQMQHQRCSWDFHPLQTGQALAKEKKISRSSSRITKLWLQQSHNYALLSNLSKLPFNLCFLSSMFRSVTLNQTLRSVCFFGRTPALATVFQKHPKQSMTSLILIWLWRSVFLYCWYLIIFPSNIHKNELKNFYMRMVKSCQSMVCKLKGMHLGQWPWLSCERHKGTFNLIGTSY